MTTSVHAIRTRAPRHVTVFVAGLVATALAVAVTVAPSGAPNGTAPAWWALPLLGALLVAATWFVVPFRFGTSVDAVNLVEAALAPLLLTFPPLIVIAMVVLSQLINGALRALPAIKTTFNCAMWAVAAGLGSMVVQTLGAGSLWPQQVAALALALAVVGLVNTTTVVTVVALAERLPLRQLATRGVPVSRWAWTGGWGVNVAVGVLFSVTFAAAPAASALFVVPLGVLHLAYRSYTAARADQALLVAAHGAAAHLATPLYPLAAVPQFLLAVAEAFDATAAELVIRSAGGDRSIHHVDRATGQHTTRTEPAHVASLQGAVAATPGAVRISAAGGDAMSRSIAQAGLRTCLAAPLRHGNRLAGAILVLDRGGFDGSDAGEIAVLEALARETSSALAKGRLLTEVLDERRQLGEIVDSTSDGILSISATGRVLTWNNALEQITGFAADEMVDRADLAVRLRLRTLDGLPVYLGAPPSSLPTDLLVTTASGATRHLSCSYSAGARRESGASLVVVARDVTAHDEHEALRDEVTRLVEVEAERRLVVEQLQQAVLPGPLSVAGATTAATYEPSDPTEPTGGDLYDWQLLPSGEVHLAVVDVLGHGVAATKDALAVIHTLRVVTAQGTPLDQVVGRADALLQTQNPDLVATVIVGRYEPDTGRLRVASGGHPPALVVSPDGQVRQVAASGGVIGWPGAGSDNVAEAVLEPGDALVLYTDGLVEARKNILDGMDDLERHAGEVAALPAAELANELVARALAGADRRDDTLALVLRRDPVPPPVNRGSWTISPDTAAVRQLRRTVAAWLGERHIVRDDVLLAAGELLANAARAARTHVSLHLAVGDAGLVIDVTDDGLPPRDLARRGTLLPPHDAEGGRGLYLVRALATHVDVLATVEGTTVRAVLPASRPGRAATNARPAAAHPVLATPAAL